MKGAKNGQKPRLKIGVVVQRYGEEVNGGAELHARWLAEHLQALGEVHVLTTCALDYISWANHYPPGDSELNGVTIHRFAVDAERHAYRPPKLPDEIPSIIENVRDVQRQGPISTRLFRYLQDHGDDYDLFIFFTYLYATTVFGLPLVADKAILVPTAHDEPPFYQPIYRSVFHLPQAIVCNTPTEREMIRRVMRNRHTPLVVAGVGINLPDDPADPARFRDKFGVNEPFVLYVGRVDPAKNVPELLDWFVRYKKEHPSDLKLVLIGRVGVPLPDHPDLVTTGFVTEQEKIDALAACEWTILPSIYESLSMITLESWLMGKAALVNIQCEVMRAQIERAQGGLAYGLYDDFAGMMNWLRDHPAERAMLGANGRTFVQTNYDWDIIVAKFQAVFEMVLG